MIKIVPVLRYDAIPIGDINSTPQTNPQHRRMRCDGEMYDSRRRDEVGKEVGREE